MTSTTTTRILFKITENQAGSIKSHSDFCNGFHLALYRWGIFESYSHYELRKIFLDERICQRNLASANFGSRNGLPEQPTASRFRMCLSVALKSWFWLWTPLSISGAYRDIARCAKFWNFKVDAGAPLPSGRVWRSRKEPFAIWWGIPQMSMAGWILFATKSISQTAEETATSNLSYTMW